MAKDINKNEFDESTKLKLDIFGECFEEWLPVFNNDIHTEAIYVFDFFAGSGKDSLDNLGSPLVLLNKAKGVNRRYCANIKKPISFVCNEGKRNKSIELEESVDSYTKKCENTHNCRKCVYSIDVKNENFHTFFKNPEVERVFNNVRLGKFVILDQYGFSQIDETIFKQLISYPKTDFIFFISSSFIKRFKEEPSVTKYFDTSTMDFDNKRPNEIHRTVAEYFKELIPTNMEYYLHHFSIRKDKNRGNYYGLIFGTKHTLGMEKFLKVCWKYDLFSGEANYNIDNNFGPDSLFHVVGETVKKTEVEDDVKDKILSGKISTNIEGLKYVMHRGCQPQLFTDVVNQLEKERLIERLGEINYSSTNIHKAKTYHIKIL